jgi:acetolactate synthase-1/2/3 large subunit
MKKVVGGELVAAMLAQEGVDTVFGIVDGTYMGLHLAFEKYGIRLFSPRHETSAAHMAGAYARATGKLGVCMASNGPGVANILPGVAVENAEGNRVLLLTSCRRPGIVYPDRGGAYQVFDQVGVTSAMSKWSGAVPSFDRVGEMMRKALRTCFEGRPGVVHIDIPESVFNGQFDVEELDVRPPKSYRATEPQPAPAAQVERVAAMLRQATNPAIHAGSGVLHAGASKDLTRLAMLLQAPVTTSWAARGAISDAHELALPIYAMKTVNRARSESDVVVVVGSRLGETDWWGKAPYWGDPAVQKLVQVDIEADALGRNKPTTEAVLADAGAFLSALCDALEANPVDPKVLAQRRIWCAELAEERQAIRAQFDMALQNKSVPMHTAQVPAACRDFYGEDDVVVIDGGNTAVWSNFFLDIYKPGTSLSTFKFGMLGAGVSQALGAKIAKPDSRVVCIIGDGAMGFHVQELETAARHGCPRALRSVGQGFRNPRGRRSEHAPVCAGPAGVQGDASGTGRLEGRQR